MMEWPLRIHADCAALACCLRCRCRLQPAHPLTGPLLPEALAPKLFMKPLGGPCRVSTQWSEINGGITYTERVQVGTDNFYRELVLPAPVVCCVLSPALRATDAGTAAVR